MPDVLSGPGWCQDERIEMLMQIADSRGALVVCGAPRELGISRHWVRDAQIVAGQRGWVQTTAYEKTARRGRPMTAWAPRRRVVIGTVEQAALSDAIAKSEPAQRWLEMLRQSDKQDTGRSIAQHNNRAPFGAEDDTMSKEAQKLASAAAAARAKVKQAIEETRESEAALVNAIADDVHAQHMSGVRWAKTVEHFGCTTSVYYSARKLGKKRAEAAHKAAVEAAAAAEAEAEAARKAEAEDAERKATAEADAALAGGGILAVQPATDTASDARKELRDAANAIAQIIESALVAHGIKVVKNQINRSVNVSLRKNRSDINRPMFMFELRTDWRLADGIVTPTAASAAPDDEIGKLRTGCDGLRAVLAMAQMQLDAMVAAKSGKP